MDLDFSQSPDNSSHNNQTLQKEEDSGLPLNNAKDEYYREPLHEKGNELTVSQGKERVHLEKSQPNNKMPSSILKSRGPLQNSTASFKKNKASLPPLPGKKVDEKEGETKLIDSIKLNIDDEKVQKNSRDHLDMVGRMSSSLREHEKEFFTVNVEPGLLDDKIQIFLDGVSEKLMTCKFQITLLGKKAKIYCQKNLIGTFEGNALGSIFNVYSVNAEEVERKLIASVIYESGFNLKKIPRKATIYIADSSFPSLPDKSIESLKDAFDQNPSESRIQVLQMLQPRLEENERCVIPLTKQKVLPSIHNCVFNLNKQKVLKVFRGSQNQYQMCMKAPLSPLIGYCYLLSSFSFKWITQ